MTTEPERTYSSAEVCKILDISKSSLFRWEKDDWFPPVRRDSKNRRLYTQTHLQTISDRLLKKRYEDAAIAEDERFFKVSEENSLHKFIFHNDPVGLRELNGMTAIVTLSLNTVIKLLEEAIYHYQYSDEVFLEILKLATEQTEKRIKDVASGDIDDN